MGWFDDHILSGNRAFIIAEAGINHNGHFDLALELVRQAKEAGADCVKFQTFSYEACESRHSTLPGYFTGRFGFETKKAFYDSITFTPDQFRELKGFCESLGIVFLSTACDEEGLRILQSIGAEVVKIGSSDTTNDPLLLAVARANLSVILSTGMSAMGDVTHAVTLLQDHGCERMALLQCTSQYPSLPGSVELRVMDVFKERFGVPVGLSDHTRGTHIPVAAVARGAAIIEKHFTLSRQLPGVDHAASLEPDEFATMVAHIRDVEAALGTGSKHLLADESGNAPSMRKSLMAARPLKAGTILEIRDIVVKRPGTGLAPTHLDALLGKELIRDLAEEDFFTLDMVRDPS